MADCSPSLLKECKNQEFWLPDGSNMELPIMPWMVVAPGRRQKKNKTTEQRHS
jgi:hypothetical protein